MAPTCPECGVALPEKSLATKCPGCLNRGYLKVMLGREVEVRPADSRIWVALDHATRSSHLALAVEPAMAYCGLRLTQARNKRRAVDRTKRLEGICGTCILALLEVEQQRAAAAAQGGES